MSDRVGSVLNYVDNQIHDEGVHRLKLIVYPLLNWSELEKCKKPSQIYLLLEDRDCLGSRAKALQMFIFALRAIGGKLRGKHCAQETKTRLSPDLAPPDLDFSQQSKKFRFFFYLVKIARRLPEQCHETVIQHFARVGGVNYRFIKGLPDLFIRLYQDTKISEDNSRELITALYDCKESFSEGTTPLQKLEKCISYLVDFHGVEGDPFTQGDVDSTATSLHGVDPFEGRKRKRSHRRQSKKANSHSTSAPLLGNNENESSDTPRPKESESSEKFQSDAETDGFTDSVILFRPATAHSGPFTFSTSSVITRASIDTPATLTSQIAEYVATHNSSPTNRSVLSINVDNNDEISSDGTSQPIPPVSQQQHRRQANTATSPERSEYIQGTANRFWDWWTLKRKISALLLVIMALLLVAAISLCSKFVWAPLGQSSSHSIQHRERNIPILAQVNAFLSERISIQQDYDEDDSLHTISIYLSDSDCDDLPTLITSRNYSGTTPPDIVPVYMLEGSQIAANIYASTDKTESNPLIMYILRTVEDYLLFDPHHLHTKDYRRKIPVGTNKQPKHTKFTYKIHDRGYYSVRFSHPDITLTYNLTTVIKHLNIDAINATLVGILRPDDDDQKTGTTISFETRKQCLFADIQESSIQTTNNYTTIKTSLVPRCDAALGITLSVTIFILLGNSLIVVVCIKRRHGSYTQLD